MTIGCWQGFALSSRLKYGLHADSTTLCAVNEHPSHARVTSTKSSSSFKCRNDDNIDAWKSFHRSEYCCSGEVSPPIGQSEGAISTPMVEPFGDVLVRGLRFSRYVLRIYLRCSSAAILTTWLIQYSVRAQGMPPASLWLYSNMWKSFRFHKMKIVRCQCLLVFISIPSSSCPGKGRNHFSDQSILHHHKQATLSKTHYVQNLKSGSWFFHCHFIDFNYSTKICILLLYYHI